MSECVPNEPDECRREIVAAIGEVMAILYDVELNEPELVGVVVRRIHGESWREIAAARGKSYVTEWRRFHKSIQHHRELLAALKTKRRVTGPWPAA